MMTMSKKMRGTLAVISGFSGAGKGTVIKRLLEKHGDSYCLSVSATTRLPRDGEKEGVHYFFKTTAQFEQMIRENKFLEYACYVNNYYGTPKAFVEEKLEAGIHVLLEIEIQGALNVKSQYPDALLLFITPPSAGELEKRLRGRGTETEEVIQGRLMRACEEAGEIKKYDYLVVNDDVDECVEMVHKIICSASDKVTNNSEFIDELSDGLRVFKKGE